MLPNRKDCVLYDMLPHNRSKHGYIRCFVIGYLVNWANTVDRVVVTHIIWSGYGMVENIVGGGKNAGYQQFILLP